MSAVSRYERLTTLIEVAGAGRHLSVTEAA
jgi:hypothetical protein